MDCSQSEAWDGYDWARDDCSQTEAWNSYDYARFEPYNRANVSDFKNRSKLDNVDEARVSQIESSRLLVR